jgi:hypothetical protein
VEENKQEKNNLGTDSTEITVPLLLLQAVA